MADDLAPLVSLRVQLGGKSMEWTARIVRTEGEVDRSRHVHAIAEVQDPYDRSGVRQGTPLMIGMFVEAHIHGRRADDVVVLPRQSLTDQGRVLVLDVDDKLHSREVEILRLRDHDVVIGLGLKEGERICTRIPQVFVEGMHVRATAESNP